MVKGLKSSKIAAAKSNTKQKTKNVPTQSDSTTKKDTAKNYALKWSILSNIVEIDDRQFDDCNRDEYLEMMEEIEEDTHKYDKSHAIHEPTVYSSKESAMKAATTKVDQLIKKVMARSEPDYGENNDEAPYVNFMRKKMKNDMFLTQCNFLTDCFGADMKNKTKSMIKVEVVEIKGDEGLYA